MPGRGHPRRRSPLARRTDPALHAVSYWLLDGWASTFGGNSYNETYGSLAGVIVLMLYVYYSALIMLVGAEMNQAIENLIPGGEGEKIPEAYRKPGIHRLTREKHQDGEGR